MKIILTILAIVFFVQVALSQDLIVTTKGDSINCKITKVKNENIYFTFKYKDEIRNTLLPLGKVSYRATNFFQKSELPQNKIPGNKNYQQWRFSIYSGYAYETAEIGSTVPADFKDYVRQLKSGFVWSTGLTYYFSEMLGFGAKYARFSTSNSLNNIYLENSLGERQYGRMSDKIAVNFIGPTFSTRFLNARKNSAFTLGLGMGYMGYKDDEVLINNYKMTGSTFGMSYDIGYEFNLSKNTNLGIQLSLLSGNLFKYKLDDGTTIQTIKLEKDEYESLSRIDLTIGLVFGK
ncbi:MAG: hypothetical protein Q8908_12440 [Bacteroidota bacterium]|nr:hypothetical protein [Bacteroidota bacterium]